MEDIIIIRSPFKIPNGMFNPIKNPSTGQFPSCVKRVNKDGDMILSQEEISSGEYFIPENAEIEIHDGKVFDLTNEIDRKQWEAIRYHKSIAKDRDETDSKGNLIIDGNAKKYGTASWYVEVPGKETTEKNALRRRRLEAQNYVIKDTPEDRELKAKVLGKPTYNIHSCDIEDYLMQEAERNPEKIINLYTGGDMALRLLFIKAKEQKVIEFKDKIWIYADHILGANDDAVILWMKQEQNQKIVTLIKQEVEPESFTQKK